MAIAYLLGGGAAVGKTTLAYELCRQLPEPHLYMMPEVTDSQIVGFQLDRDHDKSARLTRRLLAWAIRKNWPLICDYAMGGKNEKEFVELLLGKGYEVHLIFVDIPVEESMRRAVLRKRLVPPNVINDFHIKAAKNFFTLRSLPVMSVSLYDNSTEDIMPKMHLVYHREGGSTIINDQAKYLAYKRKAQLEGDGSGYHIFNSLDDVKDLESMICGK